MSEQLRLQFPDLPETVKAPDQILSYLGTGKVNAVSMAELAGMMHTDLRGVRRKIHLARLSGAVIIGTNSGYYLPSCEEELKEYLLIQHTHLRSKAKALQTAEQALKDHCYPSGDQET